jgi:hypothetical protein
MSEISKREKQTDWACRILVTIGLLTVIAGYIVYLQTKYQLQSPLIPPGTAYEIVEPYIKASLVSSGLFLAGLWFYSFKRKIIAIIFFSLSILGNQLFLILFFKT